MFVAHSRVIEDRNRHTKERLDMPVRDMTIRQVADMLQTHPQTVQRWIREGRLDAYRVGDRILRITPEALEAFLRERGR